ncbi:MAG: ComF family protein, partial [Clostridia bacterium]|nr:ComF family protein [Clostridia bacterium]
SYDTIIPVPISKKRRKERGYNQSELIAKEMAKNLGIEYNTDCLFKVKNIVEQSKLNKEERQKNIQGVYELHKQNKLQNKKILLIDDIYTTGSTVNECCKILKQASPKQIEVFTLAKD